MSKTGHAFIKERMRLENAIYGGEMSAHHYFRDFAYCDSGMIPWLLVAELLSVENQSLSSMVKERIAAFPSSGEINLKLADPKASISKVDKAYRSLAILVDETDGISMEFKDEEGKWRFNLRSSNTEPVVRLNVESVGNIKLMNKRTDELLTILRK
jgi:phosphomannomutase